MLILIYLVALIVMGEQFKVASKGSWDRLILGGLLLFGIPNGIYLLYVTYRYVRTGE